MSKAPSRVYVGLIFVQVVFAVHYLASKVLLAWIDPAAWAVLRIVSAAAVMLALYPRAGVRRIAWRDLGLLALFSVFGVVLNQICFIEGLSRTTPAHSALINTTIPIATILFAVLLGREGLAPRRAVGIGVGFLGVLVLLRVDRLDLRAEWFLGDVLTQVNAASFGFFLVISKNLIRRVGAIPSTVAVLCFGAVGIALYGGGSAARLDYAAVPARIWWIAAFIVVFPTVIAYFLNYWALSKVDSSQVALFVYLQPILAAGLSVALLDEPVTARLVFSTALVFVGVFLATGGAARTPAPVPEPAART